MFFFRDGALERPLAFFAVLETSSQNTTKSADPALALAPAGRRLGPPWVWSFDLAPVAVPSLQFQASASSVQFPCTAVSGCASHSSGACYCLQPFLAVPRRPPSSSRASETASEGLSRHLTSCLGRTLSLWPSETAFWHPLTPRSASSSASETTLEGLSRHLTSCTLFLWPSDTAFWAPSCLRDCFGRPLTPSHLLHSVFMTVRNCFLAQPLLQYQACSSKPPHLPCVSLRCRLWVCKPFLGCVLLPTAVSCSSETSSIHEPLTTPLSPTLTLRSACSLKGSLAAPPWPQTLLRRLLTPSHLVPWPHSVCMAVRNCLLAPSKAPNPSQRLEQCLTDCFGSLAPSAPPAMPQTLLRKASHAISPRALAALCLYGSPKLPFGTLKGS